jgi:hypothetical protein
MAAVAELFSNSGHRNKREREKAAKQEAKKEKNATKQARIEKEADKKKKRVADARTDDHHARVSLNEATQLEELQEVVDAADVRKEAAEERERNARARSQVVDHGTPTWWNLMAESWVANGEMWDAMAKSYDAKAEMSYVSVQAAKKRAESTCELMVEWNDYRKKAADYRLQAVDSRKLAATCELMVK